MIKIGIIGAGEIADKHLKCLNVLKEFDVKSITSRTQKKAIFLSKKYKIKKIYKTIDEMFLKEKLDAVAVFVNAENMFNVLNKVIRYRKIIFFEKPAALTLAETLKLKKLSKKYKTKSMIGLNRRFYSNFEKGLKFLKKNGGLKGFVVEGHERFWKIKNKRNRKIIKNWIYANSIHTLDLLRFFGGEIKSFKTFSNHNGYSKNFTISLKFKNNVIGTYISNWNSPGGWSVKLYGDRHTVIFSPLEKGIIIDQKFKIKKIIPENFDKKFKPGFYKQMVSFKNFVKTGKLKSPAQSLNDFARTLNLIESI